MASSISNQITAMQNSTAQMKAAEKAKTGTSNEINGDAFMTLMLEQLKNQDPTNPMDNTEFLAQQAQFTMVSSLEEIGSNLENLNSSISASNEITQACSLMGKTVVLEDPEDKTKTISGKVDSVNFGSKGTTIEVNGNQYSIGYVLSISDAAAADSSASGETSSSSGAA